MVDLPRARGAQDTQDPLARLEALVERARGDVRGLAGEEVLELGERYRAAMTALALARAQGASAGERARLDDVAGRAHALVYGEAVAEGDGVRAWLVALLLAPVAVRRAWRWHLLSALLLLLGALYGWVGAARDPDWALEVQLGAGDERTPYAGREELLASLRAGRPGQEGADDPGMGVGSKAVFAAFLWQNNTRAGLLAFFTGPLAGVPSAAVMTYNGVILGAYTTTFVSRGLAFEWFAWILPHGVTELLAIVLLGGGGLWIGSLVVAPGERTRREALREARGDVLRHALLAFPMLFLAALLESFVRQSGLSDPGRYVFAAVTAVVWAGWLGLARPPRAWLLALQGTATRAERGAPPTDPATVEEALAAVELELRAALAR